MWQTKYASTVPKNLGVGVNFRPCSEGYFLSGRDNNTSAQNNSLKGIVLWLVAARTVIQSPERALDSNFSITFPFFNFYTFSTFTRNFFYFFFTAFKLEMLET